MKTISRTAIFELIFFDHRARLCHSKSLDNPASAQPIASTVPWQIRGNGLMHSALNERRSRPFSILFASRFVE